MNGIEFFERHITGREDIMQIRTNDLEEFYMEASNDKRKKVFSVLQSYHGEYARRHDNIRAAHSSFLIAYYFLLPYREERVDAYRSKVQKEKP